MVQAWARAWSGLVWSGRAAGWRAGARWCLLERVQHRSVCNQPDAKRALESACAMLLAGALARMTSGGRDGPPVVDK